jgi:hypothetical protein
MPAATVAARASETTIGSTAQKVDVAVVGAGFAGLYLLHRLRKAGFVRQYWTKPVMSAAPGTGTDTGARCDVQTLDYSYTFDPELESAWRGLRNTQRSPKSCPGQLRRLSGFPHGSAYPRSSLCSRCSMLLRGGLCLLGLPVLLPDYWMIIICGRRGSVTPEHVPLARLKFCTAKLLPSLHSPEARNHPSLVWVDLQCR